jgi:hypothetical protein
MERSMIKEWKAVAWYSHEKTSIITGDPGEWSSIQLIAECHTTEADASVMSASRELLEALKELREAIKSRGVISTVKALSKADAAIAKATGSAA